MVVTVKKIKRSNVSWEQVNPNLNVFRSDFFLQIYQFLERGRTPPKKMWGQGVFWKLTKSVG